MSIEKFYDIVDDVFLNNPTFAFELCEGDERRYVLNTYDHPITYLVKTASEFNISPFHDVYYYHTDVHKNVNTIFLDPELQNDVVEELLNHAVDLIKSMVLSPIRFIIEVKNHYQSWQTLSIYKETFDEKILYTLYKYPAGAGGYKIRAIIEYMGETKTGYLGIFKVTKLDDGSFEYKNATKGPPFKKKPTPEDLHFDIELA